MHLLVVVRDRDVEFVTRPDDVLQVAADALVQVGAVALEETPVCGVANEDVVEAVDRVVAGPRARWLDEVFPAESVDEGTEPVGDVAAGDGAEQPPVELGADHGGEFDDLPLVVGQAFDAAGEQGQDGGWDLDRVDVDREMPPVAGAGEDAVVDEHLDQFADEERVALGRVRDPFDEIGGQFVGVQQACGELPGGVGIEALEPDRRRDPAARLREFGPQLAELRAGESEQHHRRGGPLGEVIEQIPEQRLGPLDVVDDDQQRFVDGEVLQ